MNMNHKMVPDKLLQATCEDARWRFPLTRGFP